VKLYRMNRDDFCLDRRHEHICLRKKTDIADFHLFYKNDGFAAVGEIQIYVDEISRDLSEHINGYGMFLGDETEREDLREAWFQQGLNLINVYAIDADNDGQDEYFERVGYYYSGNQIGRQVSWYNENLEQTLSPFATWNAARYQVKQLWFKNLTAEPSSLLRLGSLAQRIGFYWMSGSTREGEQRRFWIISSF